MTEQPQRPNPRRGRVADDEEIRALLAEAGPRPAVPPDDLAAILAAARAAQELRRPQRRPRASEGWSTWRPWPVLLAASLLLAIAASAWYWVRPTPVTEVATVESVWGECRRETLSGTDGMTLRAGETLPAGTRLATGPRRAGSRSALRLAGGRSLRLDADTAVRLVSPTRIALDAGALYVDSGPEGVRGGGLQIETAMGAVRETGTQFEVRYSAGQGSEVLVRVREGSVALDTPAASNRVATGEQVTLSANGTLARSLVDRAAPVWQWAAAAAPAPAIEGRSLRWFLDWACRENGWQLRFAAADLASEVETVVLHGTIAGLTPDESVDVVLAGAGLVHRIEGGELVVARPLPGGR